MQKHEPQYARLVDGSDIEIGESDSLIETDERGSNQSCSQEQAKAQGLSYPGLSSSKVPNRISFAGPLEALAEFRRKRQVDKNDEPQRSNSLAKLVMICIAFILLFILYLNSYSPVPVSIGSVDKFQRKMLPIDVRQMGNNWIVSSAKCLIPKLPAWDASISRYTSKKNTLDCESIFGKNATHTRPLSYTRDNKLYFSLLDGETSSNFSCCYKSIKRSADNDGDLLINQTCTPWTQNGLEGPESLIEINCERPHVYKNVHMFIKLDKKEEDRLDKLAEEKLNDDDRYSVLLLGFDTMSRLNQYRQLSQTLRILRKQYEVLEFYGFNKVGENTFPNLVPLLSGLKPQQLDESGCWTGNKTFHSESSATFDGCKFLWDSFAEVGYRTYYSEDWPDAATFNYIKGGFQRQPTNVYGRPFSLARKDFEIKDKCVYNESIYQSDISILKNFATKYKGKPYFALHWANRPQHDDLNGGSTIDEFAAETLKDLYPLTKNNKTFLFVLSDHGWRWQSFMSTRIGHYETSLPMLNIAMPKHFIRKHPDLVRNLRLHQHSLLTPFDLYHTILSIRNLSIRKNERPEMARTHVIGKGTTGESLVQNFTTISILDNHTLSELDKSCKEKDIPDNFCVCHDFEPASANSNEVWGAAMYYVYVHLYTLLTGHLDICQELDLKSIEQAQQYNYTKMTSFNESESKISRSDVFAAVEYNIRLTTSPNDGQFQEVVRYQGKSASDCQYELLRAREIISDPTIEFEPKHKLALEMNKACGYSVHSDSVARLNLYGNQSACVSGNNELKKVCLCRSKT